MKASDLFVKALESEGVKHIFGVPGEENLDFLESVRNSSIELVLTRHEQGAGFMAATYGRLTGKTGVCLSTLGPGATNFVTAAAYAQLGGMPMMMITGQKPIKKSKQGRFQIVDVVEMMRPITKFTKQIVNGNLIPTLVREAFRLAEEERPGAVHLELPEDIAPEDTETHIIKSSNPARPTANNEDLKRAAEVIKKAKMPLLLIGAGANRKHCVEALTNFVNTLGMPFFTTQMGKGVIDGRHELCLGTAALSDNDYIHCAINRADLIINVGHDVVEKPPFFMHEGGTKVIHVNYFPAYIDEVYFPNVEVVGDINDSLCNLAKLVGDHCNWDLSYFQRVKKEMDIHINQDHADDPRFPIIPQRLVREVRKAVPDDGIIALDNGIYKIWFARNYRAHQPNTVLLDNALATMGAGLPSAMAAKMVHPHRKVVAICGDGGFMMNVQELETAVRLKLDLVILLLHDDAYGMIKWKQEAAGFKEYGLDFGNPDFVKLAECHGAHGHLVENTEGFGKLLKNCINSKGVHLIDVPVDYSENVKALVTDLKEKACVI